MYKEKDFIFCLLHNIDQASYLFAHIITNTKQKALLFSLQTTSIKKYCNIKALGSLFKLKLRKIFIISWVPICYNISQSTTE